MTGTFSVRTSPRFDRLARKLRKQHQDRFTHAYRRALEVGGKDPYNQTGEHAVTKLTDTPTGTGQYRPRIGRFRFRYDVAEATVLLHECALRQEDTYRSR